VDEIIYLEPDEEITSAIDKIKNAKSANIGLVVPRGATLLQSVVNLRLLSKEASVLNKKIAIVTTDKIGRNLVSQVGLPVYNSIQEERPVFTPQPPTIANDEVIEIDSTKKKEAVETPDGVNIHHFQDDRPVIRWRPQQKPVFVEPQSVRPEVTERALTKKHLEVNPIFKKIIWLIAVVAIVLFIVVFYLLFPRAQVAVFMKAEDLKKTIALTISGNVPSASIEQNIFSGNLIEAFVETSQKFPATGKKNIGEKAKGQITVYNSWESSPRTFVAGTKFSNSAKTFIASNSFTVPGTAIREGNLVPGTVTVNIESEAPGEEYNVKAGRFTIIGLASAQQEKIYGSSSKDLTGGFSREAQVVSQEDYDQAKAKILIDLTAKVDQELKNEAKGDKILEKAVVANDPEIISSSGVDQEAKEFEMKVRLRKQAMVFNFQQFTAFLTQILSKQAPSDKMVVIPSEEDYGLIVDQTAYDKKELNLTANVLAKISSRIDAEKIKTAIIGKKKSAAEKYILSQGGTAKVEFNFRPSWLNKIPDLAKNTQVEIKYIAGQNAATN